MLAAAAGGGNHRPGCTSGDRASGSSPFQQSQVRMAQSRVAGVERQRAPGNQAVWGLTSSTPSTRSPDLELLSLEDQHASVEPGLPSQLQEPLFLFPVQPHQPPDVLATPLIRNLMDEVPLVLDPPCKLKGVCQRQGLRIEALALGADLLTDRSEGNQYVFSAAPAKRPGP
jgi:hypothetical protein